MVNGRSNPFWKNYVYSRSSSLIFVSTKDFGNHFDFMMEFLISLNPFIGSTSLNKIIADSKNKKS